MGLTKRREEIVKKMPHIETRLELSEDRRFLVHKTVITDIRPVASYRKEFELDF